MPKVFVERINILGNNVTRENVRNQVAVDEGDPFNLLLTKSVNNLKSLNLFKSVNYKLKMDQMMIQNN